MFTQWQLYFILEDHLLGITSFTCLLDCWQLSLTTTLKGRLDLTIPRSREVTMISQYGLGYRGSAYSAHDTTNFPFLWKGIQDAALYLEKLTTRACSLDHGMYGAVGRQLKKSLIIVQNPIRVSDGHDNHQMNI
jgi:hypothetical protein